VVPDLREVHFGRGEGLTQREMAAEFPDALTRFRAAPASSPLPEAESRIEAGERAVTALRTVRAEREGELVLVVAHSTLIRLVLCRLLGIPIDDYRRVFPAVHNIALTTVRLDDRGAALLAYNVSLPRRNT